MKGRGESQRGQQHIAYTRLHLAVRWSTILLPFEQARFLSLLPGEGYVVSPEVAEGLRGFTAAAASGRVARKGKTALDMDVDKATLGIEASEPGSLISDFEEIEMLLESQLGFGSREHAHFYELLASGLITVNRPALDLMRSLELSASVTEPLSAAFGLGRLRDVSIKLVQEQGTALSPNWCEVQIDPSFRSDDQLRFNIVYRSGNRDEVLGFATRTEAALTAAARVLETLDR